MVNNVDSCPPCMLLLLVNTLAGLPIKSPDSHTPLVPSKKYFIAAAILPKRVGLPMAKPAQVRKSSMLTYGAPLSGMLSATCSHTVETLGTVRNTASQPAILSMPLAISRAKFNTLPF